jgi:hypothetical protein
VEERATAVVVRGQVPLHCAWHCLKFSDHLGILSLLLGFHLHAQATGKASTIHHVWRQGAQERQVSLISLSAQHCIARQKFDGICKTASVGIAAASATFTSALPSSVAILGSEWWWWWHSNSA